MKLALFLVVASGLVSLAGTASAEDAVKPSTNAGAPAPKVKKVCRPIAADTGSIMPRRICKTKEEWDALTAQNERSMDSLNTSGRPIGMGFNNAM